MFRIGEFASLAGVSIRMLRHYDELGLLVPAHVDLGTRYRYYTADQLPRLTRILALKDLGFPLDRIGPLLGENVSVPELRRMLRLRRVELERRMRAERARLTGVEARLLAVERDGRDLPYDVVVRPVPSQLMATIRQVVPSLGPPIERLFDEAEAYAARHRARAARSPLMIFHGAEYRATDLHVEVAIPLLRPTPTDSRVSVREVPGAATMACAVYTGGYERTAEALDALRAWADANGWAVAGAPREVYVRFGADHADALRLPRAFLTDRRDRYVTEVQLPVKPAHA